jgi:hypothetical protein
MENAKCYAPQILVGTEGLPREQWLEYRRKGIGGSDAAAVLGISPFRTGRDLYYDKLNMPHVDTDTCHEAVDFLRDFEKANRAEKPDQDIPRHGLAAGTADCGFNIAFLQSKRRYRQGERKQKNGAQQRNDSMIFLRGNDLLHGKRI